MAPARTTKTKVAPQDRVDRLALRDHPDPRTEEADYIARNRAAWDEWATGHVAAGRKAWRDKELRWGVWGIPESKLQLTTDMPPGSDVIELGSGSGEISAHLARMGMRPVAIDLSPKQVRTVEALQREHALSFPTFCANAESVLYEESSFDVAISEYGASLWCDPIRWLPEAHRLLRPGGTLVFFANSALLMLCTPESGAQPETRLQRDFFAPSRFEYGGNGGPSSSTRRTEVGFACYISTDSCSRTSSRYGLRRTRPRATTSSVGSGHAAGPARRSGSRGRAAHSPKGTAHAGDGCSSSSPAESRESDVSTISIQRTTSSPMRADERSGVPSRMALQKSATSRARGLRGIDSRRDDVARSVGQSGTRRSSPDREATPPHRRPGRALGSCRRTPPSSTSR